MSPEEDRKLVAYTPMLHARMFTETAKFRDNHFQPLRRSLLSNAGRARSSTPEPDPNPPAYLDGNPAIDRPLFTQFCANDPEELLKAAQYVAPYCDAVDLNLGCPQGIARKGKYGAFLQEDQELIFSLINKLHVNLDVPITAKIRILETKEKTLEYARNVLRAGASILTVHGRHRDQKGHKTGLADWRVIRYLRESLPRETVIFANGNILRKEDITQCITETGVDGVMSAEGNLYDPSIFADPPPPSTESREYWRGMDGKGGWRMDAAFRRYMDILYKYVLEVPVPDRKPLFLPTDPVEPPAPINEVKVQEEEEGPPRKKQKKDGQKKERTTSPNLLAMQPHLFKLLRPLVARHHHVRDALARSRAGDIAAFENVLQLVESVVKDGLKEYHETNGRSWEKEEEDVRSKALKAAAVAPAPILTPATKIAPTPAATPDPKSDSTKLAEAPTPTGSEPTVVPLEADDDVPGGGETNTDTFQRRKMINDAEPSMHALLEGKGITDEEERRRVVLLVRGRLLGIRGRKIPRVHPQEELLYSVMRATFRKGHKIRFQPAEEVYPAPGPEEEKLRRTREKHWNSREKKRASPEEWADGRTEVLVDGGKPMSKREQKKEKHSAIALATNELGSKANSTERGKEDAAELDHGSGVTGDDDASMGADSMPPVDDAAKPDNGQTASASASSKPATTSGLVVDAGEEAEKAEVQKKNTETGEAEEKTEKDKEQEAYESSLAMVQACRRPWWIVQPYVRPLPMEALAKGALTLGKKDRKELEKKIAAAGKEKEVVHEG